jgi:hypothetical protein
MERRKKRKHKNEDNPNANSFENDRKGEKGTLLPLLEILDGQHQPQEEYQNTATRKKKHRTSTMILVQSFWEEECKIFFLIKTKKKV